MAGEGAWIDGIDGRCDIAAETERDSGTDAIAPLGFANLRPLGVGGLGLAAAAFLFQLALALAFELKPLAKGRELGAQSGTDGIHPFGSGRYGRARFPGSPI